MSSVMPGRLTLISELDQVADRASIRIVGRVDRYDPGAGVVSLAMDGHATTVEVDLIAGVAFDRGALISVIGERQCGEWRRAPVRARVAFNVDGLDLTLYKRCLHMTREFDRAVAATESA